MQNVNLISTLSKRPNKYLSAEWLTQGAIIFTLTLILIYIFSYWPLNKQKILVKYLNTEKELLVKQTAILELLTTKYSNQVSRKEQLPKFSPYLEGLAKSTPENVWLKNISFSPQKDVLDISGNSLGFYLVTDFIKNLADFNVFSPCKITNVSLMKVEKGDELGSVSFHLSREEESVKVQPPNVGNAR